jgi:hypothetical protein
MKRGRNKEGPKEWKIKKSKGKETKKEQKIRAERTERPLIIWNPAFYEILTSGFNFYG